MYYDKTKHKHFRKKGCEHPSYTTGVGTGHDHKLSKALRCSPSANCKLCGSRKDLVTHHIDYNPRNNKLDNLQVLCNLCHAKTHRKWNSPKERNQYYHKQRKLLRLQNIKQLFYKAFGSYDIWRTNDLCNKLGVSKERIRQLRVAGKIPYIKVGGNYFHYF